MHKSHTGYKSSHKYQKRNCHNALQHFRHLFVISIFLWMVFVEVTSPTEALNCFRLLSNVTALPGIAVIAALSDLMRPGWAVICVTVIRVWLWVCSEIWSSAAVLWPTPPHRVHISHGTRQATASHTSAPRPLLTSRDTMPAMSCLNTHQY